MAIRHAPFESDERTGLVLVHAEIVAEIHVVAFAVRFVEAHVGVEGRQEPACDELEPLVAGLQGVRISARGREAGDRAYRKGCNAVKSIHVAIFLGSAGPWDAIVHRRTVGRRVTTFSTGGNIPLTLGAPDLPKRVIAPIVGQAPEGPPMRLGLRP